MHLQGRRLRLVFTLSLVICSLSARSQQGKYVISGTVLDSLTRLPVPYVTIRNRSTNGGTSASRDGAFTITATIGDSLIFTMVGYKIKQRIVTTSTRFLVLIQESAQLLKPVVIYGSYKPLGSDQWKDALPPPKIFVNPAGPGSGYAIQTFGPGVSLGGLLGLLSKINKEKVKVKTLRNEYLNTDTYRTIVNSSEVKAYFQKTFSLSETDYYRKVAQFNTQYPEAAHLKTKDEIINLMVMFFATKNHESEK